MRIDNIKTQKEKIESLMNCNTKNEEFTPSIGEMEDEWKDLEVLLVQPRR